MKYFIRFGLLLFTILLINGCSFIKPLEFETINSFKVQESSGRGITVVANLTLYNPNGVKIVIDSADIDVYAEGVNLGKLQIPELIVIDGKSEFTGNYRVEINFTKLLLAGKNVISKLRSGKIEVNLKGVIEADFLWMHKKFNVNYTEKVNMR